MVTIDTKYKLEKKTMVIDSNGMFNLACSIRKSAKITNSNGIRVNKSDFIEIFEKDNTVFLYPAISTMKYKI
jgi:hypothetical protein